MQEEETIPVIIVEPIIAEPIIQKKTCTKPPRKRKRLQPNEVASDQVLKCQFCSKICRDQNNLTRHLRQHRNEEPFKCDVCNIRFAYKVELNEHIRTHSRKCKHKQSSHSFPIQSFFWLTISFHSASFCHIRKQNSTL